MNYGQLKKNVGCRVQLLPTAIRLNENGTELPLIDDIWIINDVSAEGVKISNTRTGHETILGKDHIHHFTTNPDRSKGGARHGFLTLHIQIFLNGTKLSILPNSRPGERVDPPRDVLRRELGDYLAQGNGLCSALADPDLPSPHREANEWITKVEQLVKQHLGKDAAIQIRNPQGLAAFRPHNVDVRRGYVWNAVYVVVVRLQELIKTLDKD